MNYLKLFLIKAYLTFAYFCRNVWLFLLGDAGRSKSMQGELIVIGHDKVEIDLGDKHPKSVDVHFANGFITVPCNPHHHDDLRYSVHNRHHHHKHDAQHDHCNHEDRYVLTIHWDVSSVRLIKWTVKY